VIKMNPVEEFLGVASDEKTAGWIGDAFTSLGRGLALKSPHAGHNVANVAGKVLTTGAVASGIAAGAHAVDKGLDAAIAKYQKPRQFAAMMDAHPTLKEAPKGQVAAYFNALHTMSPTVAAEPLLAGSFVRNMMQREVEGGPAVPLETTKMMSEINKNMGQARKAAPGYLTPIMQGRIPFPDERPTPVPFGYEEERYNFDHDGNEVGSSRIKRTISK